MLQSGAGPLAQRLEQWTHNPLVPGSNPGGPTKYPPRSGAPHDRAPHFCRSDVHSAVYGQTIAAHDAEGCSFGSCSGFSPVIVMVGADCSGAAQRADQAVGLPLVLQGNIARPALRLFGANWIEGG